MDLTALNIPADRAGYAALTADALTALENAAYAAVDALRTKGASAFSATDLNALETLRDVVGTVRAEREDRTAAESKGNELLAELTPPAPAAEVPAVEQESPAAANTPADPIETPVEAAPAPEKGSLVASGKGTAPRVGAVARNAPRPVAPAPSPPEHFAALVEGPDADGKPFDSWLDVARVAERRLASYSGAKGHGSHTIATIQRNFAANLKTDDADADSVLDYAASESRLPGGSLVAAAGWCAPSQTVYDLVEMETTDGMFDLPEVQVSRGGLRFTPGPDFSSIFAGSGYFHQTEAQVIANTTKPCMEIPCPSFQDVRMEVEGLCITGSILQRRGYPELVERFIRGSLVAHMHKINAWVIAQVEAGSTAVDLDPPVDVVADTTTTNLLASVELAAEDVRYRHRLAMNATVEVTLPHWALPIMRADFSRRTGVEMTNLTDAQLIAHFSNRGARVQFVYDWQDAFTGQANTPGGATALTAWPNVIRFLAYPAGTWVRGSDSVIRLDTIYDSTNLATNRYTALFSEEGVLVAKRGHDSRVYNTVLCPSGATAATVTYACA